jgi:hypothetical protein
MGKGLVIVFAAVLLVGSAVFSDCAHRRPTAPAATSQAG